MNVDDLEQMLRELTGEHDVRPWMKIIAHWTKKIKKEGTYVTTDEEEIKSLRKIKDLGIFFVKEEDGELKASLTDEGNELSKDFFMKGYYL